MKEKVQKKKGRTMDRKAISKRKTGKTSTAIKILKTKGTKKAKEIVKTLSEEGRKALSQDIAQVEKLFEDDASLYDVLFEAINRRIDATDIRLREIRDIFTIYMGERCGTLFFNLMTSSPHEAEPFLREFGTSDKTRLWIRRCFLSFGPSIAQLEALEKGPEDWSNFDVQLLRKDGSEKLLIRWEIIRVDNIKHVLYGEQSSLFRLVVGLLDHTTNGGIQTEGCREEDILRAKEVLKAMSSGKVAGTKKKVKRRKKKR